MVMGLGGGDGGGVRLENVLGIPTLCLSLYLSFLSEFSCKQYEVALWL